MNRRELLVGAGVASTVVLLPGVPAFAAEPGLVTWEGATAASPHAAIIGKAVVDLVRAGTIYTRDPFFGLAIKLKRPSFRVMEGGKVWNWMTGWTEEPAPILSITESDVHLGDVGIATNIGYETYWNKPERDPGHEADYFVRCLWTKEGDYIRLSEALGDDQVGPDMRWTEDWIRHMKKG